MYNIGNGIEEAEYGTDALRYLLRYYKGSRTE